MTVSDRDVDLNPPCTARTSVGVGIVATVGIVLVVLVVVWWLL
jgi:hypothetical protein